MRVKALKQYYYSRRQYEPGEELDIDDREEATVQLLQKLGTVEILKSSSQPAAPTYQTTAIKAEPEPQLEPPKVEPLTTSDALTGPRRFYRRRDMRAQE